MLARLTLATALITPLLALSSCGDATSIADPPVAPSVTSAAPSRAPRRETPEHFIRRWVNLERRMENSGETGPYLRLSRGCTACMSLAKQIQAIYSAGGFVEWGGWRILNISVSSRRGQGTTYAVRNRSLTTTYRRSAHAPLQHLFGGVTTELLQLVWSDRAWNVQGKSELAS